MRTGILGVVLLLTTGCTDKAQFDYEGCQHLAATNDPRDLPNAVSACQKAVAADPNSKSGKAAAQLLATLKPQLDAQQAQAAQQAARMSAAQNRVTWKLEYMDTQSGAPDDCQDRHLPRFVYTCLPKAAEKMDADETAACAGIMGSKGCTSLFGALWCCPSLGFGPGFH